MMIARTWHGAVPSEKADAYYEILLRSGVSDYRATQGNQGVLVLRRIKGDTAHFLLLTLWDSPESIRSFAGDDVEKARYYPEDSEFLIEMEPNATHYDVLAHIEPGEDFEHKM
jgi:heme-degrading monooxygenase HmoA